MTDEKLELSLERYIAAPPEKVWRTMVDRQEEWWCPAPWRAEIVELERRAGGRNRMVFKGPDGEEMPQEGVFLAWDEGRRFVSTDAVTPDFWPTEPFMVGTWEIAPEGDGTRYRASARHWTREKLEEHKAMGFEQGWGACADQLKALCEGA